MGVSALSVMGALMGILVGVYVLPIPLEVILADYGIVQLPLLLHWSGVILFACRSFVAAALGSWFSSRVIHETSPRMLVIE